MQTQLPMRVIGPSIDGDVLNMLAQAPDASFTSGQVQRMIARDPIRRRSLPVIRQALQRLAGQGIVTADSTGTAPTYRFNAEHIAAPAVRDLARLRTLLLDRLTTTVEAWDVPPVYGAMFGSAARGEMRPDSDIDLLLIRPDESDEDTWEAQTLDLGLAIRRWTGNPAELLVFTEMEVANHADERVLHDVVRDGLTFAGSPAWLRRGFQTLRTDR
jgi:predicted nucleotidyltransferase